MKGGRLVRYIRVSASETEPTKNNALKIMQTLVDGSTVAVAFRAMDDWKQYK